MRLVRIAVDAYQCIEHAEVEFGPGLNVLFGPNDLGKSTLAGAIADVLLVPHGAAAHEDFVSWHSGDSPHVALTFSTEAQKIWRVTKTFGSGSAGSSLLEFSKDGFSFSKEASGRQVDERIRELLRWGIGKPGGRGGGARMPDSFLASVLLGSQFDVPGILDRGLGDDPHESGRARLNEALQALAQDPTFKRILDAALEQVNLAFTGTGQRSRRQGSPFKQVTDEIKELQVRQRELQTKLNETVGAEEILRRLHGELDDVAVELGDAEEHLRLVRDAHAQAAARAAVEEELGAARAALDAVRQELAAIDAAASRVEALREQIAAADAMLAEKTQIAAVAGQSHEAALQRLQEITSESGAQARQLALQQLENDKLRAERRRAELQASLAAADEAERRASQAAASQRELEVLSARLADAEAALGTGAAADSVAREALTRHGRLEMSARLLDAQRRLAAAEAAAVQAALDRQTAGQRRDDAAGLDAEVAQLDLPDAEIVAALAALAQEVEVAEARLGGGLSVSITPLQDVRVQVAVDGGAAGEHVGREPIAFEAQRSLALQVGDLVQVAITAGEAAARAAVERLRARWTDEAVPLLERAGAATLAALAEARQRADELVRQSAARRAEANALELQAAQHEQRAADLDSLRQMVAEREQALASRDRAELAEVGELGDAWETALERRRASAEAAVRAAAADLDAARSALGELKSQHAAHDAACRQAAAAAEQALAGVPDDVRRDLDAARRELADVVESIGAIVQRVEALSHQEKDEQVEAQGRLDAAVAQLAAANEAVRVAQAERDTLREALARASGSLDAQRAQAQRLDLVAAEKAVEAVGTRLAGMAQPAVPCAETDLESAQVRVERARSAVTEKRGAIQRAQGALEQVGGAVVRDHLAEIERALQLALDRERGVEVEYEAWQLLAATLREVENTDGAHLGRALAGPLAERFAALTGGRYGAVAIDQELQLEDECVEAGGQLRTYVRLSAGTQDQLATLFRLCIAEQLGSCIVLDDHLSQSDPDRIGWFRDRLRQTAQHIQVVLITCRPEDYLLADEFPSGDEVSRDRAAGSLRAVNLARVIHRYALAAGSSAATPATST